MRRWRLSSRPLPPLASHFSIGACVVGLLLTACARLLEPNAVRDPSAPPRVIISFNETGAGPREVTIPVGGFVVFYEVDDKVRHEIYSDPHPDHTSCPEINVGAFPGRTDKRSGTLNTPGVCRYHDDLRPGDARFQGTIRVQ